MRALVVDDEAIIVRAFYRISKPIKELDVVGGFQSAEEVIKYLQENSVDLAFVDTEMLGVTGIELIHRLHQMYPNMKFVLLATQENEVMETVEGYRPEYILKPFREKDITERVAALLKGEEKE